MSLRRLPKPYLKIVLIFSLIVFFSGDTIVFTVILALDLLLLNKEYKNPPAIPDRKAKITLNKAKIPPKKEYVITMESAPVCGVDIKKDITELFDAPLLLIETAVGITEHEQSGRGTPIKAAFKAEKKPGLPRNLLILFFGIITYRIPAIKKPNNKYGDICINKFKVFSKKAFISNPYKVYPGI